MPASEVYSPVRGQRQVLNAAGDIIDVPAGWELLPPGDAGLTRRVKTAGPSWVVQEKRGRKTFSQGVWAPAANIADAKAALETERQDPAYTRRLAAGRARRAREQVEYVEDFRLAVRQFLNFSPRYADLAETLAKAIADHATPVGSGTVARTERIPIERRAEAAVIAWMRHQTTAYDAMKIPRVKGQRREVRQMLAQRSRHLLEKYRRGEDADATCPLRKAISAR